MEKSEHFNKTDVYCIKEVFLLLNISKDGLHCLVQFFFSHLADYNLVLWPANLEDKPSILQGAIILFAQVPPGVGTLREGRAGTGSHCCLHLSVLSCSWALASH